MAYIDSSTSTITAILTTKGRELLAKNDGSFKITKFSYGDDEVNYNLFDASNPDNPDVDIKNLPILEPTSNEAVALLYRLITLPRGSLKIATLTVKPTQAVTNFGESITFTVETENGDDPQGYVATVRNTNIASLQSSKQPPDGNGIATFNLLTGINNPVGGVSGTTIADIVGINSGARSTFSATISASGT